MATMPEIKYIAGILTSDEKTGETMRGKITMATMPEIKYIAGILTSEQLDRIEQKLNVIQFAVIATLLFSTAIFVLVVFS
jgi:hypothetical protein